MNPRRTRGAIATLAVVFSLAAAGCSSNAAAVSKSTVTASLGGLVATDTMTAVTKDGHTLVVTSGQPLDAATVKSVTITAIAAGDEVALCRIVIDGSPVSESRGAGAGKAIACAWRAPA